ncbi:UNVERIFIED_CONTAM: NitT/TauT family transport system permease protein [Acetivibrio alkalicellulosi]
MIKKFDLLGLILPIFLVFLWGYVTVTNIAPSYILPSPSKVVISLFDFAFGTNSSSPYSGQMLEHTLMSLKRVCTGFLLGGGLGFVLGIASAAVQYVNRIFATSIHILRAMPGIGWLPIAMVWFGVGEKTSIFLIGIAAFFPIYMNTLQGAGAVDPLQYRAARMLGAKKLQLLTSIMIPSALPQILVGLRIGLSISWAYVVLGELTGVNKGLGAVMMDARMLGRLEMILVMMVCIAVLGRITDQFLLLLYRFIRPFEIKK